jgi:hypothetical protein
MLHNAIAIAFWPAVVGLALTGWLRRRDASTLATTWSAASLIGIGGIFYITIFDTTSLLVLLDMAVGTILFGALCLLTVYGCASRLTRLQCIGVGLLGFAMIGYGSEILIGDHMLAPKAVEGVVRHLRIMPAGRGPDEYLVTIGDESFKATTRLYATLRPGERVRATVGRGSGYIYVIEKM